MNFQSSSSQTIQGASSSPKRNESAESQSDSDSGCSAWSNDVEITEQCNATDSGRLIVEWDDESRPRITIKGPARGHGESQDGHSIDSLRS